MAWGSQRREARKARKLRRAQEKKPLGQRIGKHFGDKARAFGELRNVVVNEPRSLPNHAHGWFRKWFAKVWRVRGGGLYALGFAISFAIYEIQMLIEDLGPGSDFIVLFNGQFLEFFLSIIVQSMVNTVHALIWPVYVVQFAPPYGAIGLGLAFILFTRVLKKPIEGWLFDGSPELYDPASSSTGKNTDVGDA